VLGISGGRPESVLTTIDLELGGRAVGPGDVTHALALARAQARTDGVEILHALPVEITLDSSQRLRDARGMVGERLRIAVHLVRVASAPLHNLLAAVERCHLDIAAVIAAPYAAGLASLSGDEAMFGAVVLDLGAGTTGVARFADGRLQELATLPLGAHHVTQDLAFGLSTGRAQAERLKTLYGSVLVRAGDSRQHLEVPGIGDPAQPPVQIVARARLTEIIRPRAEEIFQLARARIDLDRLPITGRRLVLTGGGSQLEGIVELAEETFGMPARMGRARAFGGNFDDLTAATTAAGLLRWAGEDDGGLTFGATALNRDFTARLARLGQWLRENF
jgi:cell division protein FtsA